MLLEKSPFQMKELSVHLSAYRKTLYCQKTLMYILTEPLRLGFFVCSQGSWVNMSPK